jgi:hypothetical protein
LLGFDVLGQMVVHLDYRDGLVKLESTDSTASAAKAGSSNAAPAAEQGAECPTFDSNGIPSNQTLQLRVMGTIDSAHLKPGKEIFAQVVKGVVYPGCTLDAKSIVYGHVTAVSSSRNPDAAEMAVAFDHGDCEGQGKKQLLLYLVGLVAPPAQATGSLHGAVPSEVGGVRNISEVAARTNGHDAELGGGGGLPPVVRPGAVLGLPAMKLDPVGGPACSARISSAARSVELGTNAGLILALAEPKAAASH